ncbi:hypothetical protein T10_4134 [Trichinella papuae]|uniref:Uncharacterized protein n=1 Tax=Trichinella papuae TaxID=268474 RepID=A0A0V1LXD8_9BILA|nr:hypothetical protein T10_4134 [Trichinella papuae]
MSNKSAHAGYFFHSLELSTARNRSFFEKFDEKFPGLGVLHL